MPVPTYEHFMLPLLQLVQDGTEHKLGNVQEQLAQQFGLTDEDRQELLPSGKQRTYVNRINWARFYLGKAGLLEASSNKGWFRITSTGQALVAQNPASLNTNALMQIPQFADFKNAIGKSGQPATTTTTAKVAQEPTQTPDELLETSFQILRETLIQQVLEQIRTCSWQRFEQIVVDVLTAMGYGGSQRDAGKVVGGSGDGGIDGVIKQDPLGLDVVYLQAKRWEHSVSRPDVQGFVGSLAGRQVQKGVMITSSKFTAEATDYAKNFGGKIVLISGEQLAEHMVDHGVGVTDDKVLVVKRIDLDYYED